MAATIYATSPLRARPRRRSCVRWPLRLPMGQDSRHRFDPDEPVRAALITANVLMLAVFAADALTPSGTGVCALYGVPLLIVSYAGPRRLAIYGAWVATALIVVRPLALPA